MFHDYYEILGLDPDATDAEVKQAYRRLAREAHPDRHPDDMAYRHYEMSLINEAYHVLRNPRKRSAYDIEWRRYYNIRGKMRRSGVEKADFDEQWKHKIDKSREEPAVPGTIPFWKNQKVLFGILLVLILILIGDIYLTYFEGRTFGRGVVRDISLGYEYALGERFRNAASERHLDRSRDLPQESVRERLWQLHRALSLDPDNAEAAVEAANLLLREGHFDEALRISRRALARIENVSAGDIDDETAAELRNAESRFLRISCRSLIELGRLEEAHSMVRGLLDIAPDDEQAMLDRAWIELQLGLTESAMEGIEDFIDTHPDSELIPPAKTALAQAYLEEGRYRDAVETAEELVNSEVRYPELGMILGEAYYHIGNYGSAIENLLPALHESPDPLGVHFLVGNAYLRNSQPREASRHFMAILEQDPSDFHTHMALGDAYYAMEMMDEAREQYFEAIQIRPESAEARNALERVGE